MLRTNHALHLCSLAALSVAAGVSTVAQATFTHFSTTREVSGNLVKYTLYGNFSGPTDTVLNAFDISLVSGSATFHHSDALNGGVDSTVAGTWNPQFVLVPGAMDSYVCIGGGEGFASGNSTAADPGWGAAGFNQAQIPFGSDGYSIAGWFNQNPPNLQGRVNASGQVKLGQFVIALADESAGGTYRLKLGYNDGIPGSAVQFADSTFCLSGGDCDGNGICDLDEIADDPSIDCDANGTIDSCELASGAAADCNTNDIIDACEIANGSLSDCDADGIPDSCEGLVLVAESSPLLAPFGNGFPVSYTFANLPTASGAEPRLTIDAIADLDLSSEFIAVSIDGGPQQFYFVTGASDCPATPDRATRTFTIPEFNAIAADGSITVNLIASGTVSATQCVDGGIVLRLEYQGIEDGYDCNLNGQLDSCELADGTAFDCNGNGVLDACDIAAGLGTDCNGNGRLDSCDLADGTSSDLNGNGIPDDCANEWIVGGSGFATIQAAIDAAPSGTTIRVGPGDYNEPVLIEGKRIVLTSTDGPLRTTLDGNGLDASIVTIQGPDAAGSVITQLTFRNGSAGTLFGTLRVGGAISVLSTPSVTIGSCTFVDNACAYGGGVYCFGGSGSVNDCYFSGNSASVDGGGLEVGGQAVWLVQRCTFVNNAAALGGAMHLWSSTVSIIDTTISDNSASNRGSAISWYSIESGGTMLDGCSINRNSSPFGGALTTVAGTGAFDLIDTRFCLNAPDNYSGSIVDSGGNIFGEDCDGNGICNDAEIRDTGSSSFVWEVSEGGNGHRYLHLATPMTWEQAREYAEALGGHLATITSAEEQAALVDNFLGLNLWIGGFQSADGEEPDGGWQWVTGEPWAFTAWYSGEPNDRFGEDRLNFLPSGGWNDSGCPWACYFRIGSIIEFDAADFNGNRDCNGNGIPDVCDIAGGSESDCDADGIPDSCAIASGSIADCDANGIPDLCELGRTFAFGESTDGQLAFPAEVDFARATAAGCNHGIALVGDGQVVAWGSNSFGQTTVPSSAVDARMIAAGCDHNLAVLADGSVVAWGYNAFGQCSVPSAAFGDIVQVAAGANHSGVRKTDGSLVLWGRNADGECNVPASLGAAASFALGGAHSVGMRGDGSVVCWGLNNFGQCDVPGNVGALQAVTAGCYHTVGLRTDGTVVAWGSNIFNQSFVPPGLSGVVAVAAGSGQHTLALKSDGTVVAWGWNAFGQCDVPADAAEIHQISAGGTFSIIHREGSADCNGNGQVDACELASGATSDCNGNGVPDSCEVWNGSTADCDGDGVPDSCQIADGSANDCNGNTLLDSCELASGAAFDCDGNGLLDSCDVAMGMGSDCNENGKLDSCDLVSGTSTDLNSNGVPDECAGEWVVGGSGFRNIQAAIEAVPSGTTILVGPGTYSGGINLTTKAITLRSIAGSANTTISGAGLDGSIIFLRTAATAGTVIDGFHFTGGTVGSDEFGFRAGGAIFIADTSAEIRNCSFTDNASEYGGAVYAYNTSALVEACSFTSNSASSDGGALQFGFGGSVTLRNCAFTGNDAANNGGAVHVVQWTSGPVTTGSLESCTLSSNTAGGAGGALSWFAGLGGNLGVADCTVEGNSDKFAAFAKLPESTNAFSVRAFAISNSRFCLNEPANTSGPVESSGANIFSQDCNGNGVCDADEIASGAESDCNGNGIPDSCELGQAIAFGENSYGQTDVPAGADRWSVVSAGCNHAIALERDGGIIAWGSNSFGQTTVPSSAVDARMIAAGCDHNLAVLADGSVVAWGYNAFGQCTVPGAAFGDIVQVAAGANHSGVRKTDGSLVLWGRNADGECNVPASLGAAASFALGGAHSVGMRGDGSVVCWGLNNFGQCDVPGNVGVLQAVTAGCYHTVGLRTDGTVVAWGSNIFNQSFVPPGLSGVVAVAAGSGQHTLALKSDGTVVAWGWNAFGQCDVPADAESIEGIAAGGSFSLLRSGSPLDCNSNGEIDSCEIASGATADCNANGVPDSCEISDGTSTDLNSNGVPDECAGEWVVGGSGFRNIQAAIDAAASGTTILVGPGTYSGGINLTTKAITLRSIAGSANTTISGAGLDGSIIFLRTAATAGTVIDGFHFTGGTVGSNELGFRAGGAIFMADTSAEVRNCSFMDNASEYGGAVYAYNTSALVEACSFTSNSASSDGGALQFGFGGSVTLRNCAFTGNDAASNGGAVHVVQWTSGPVTTGSLESCTLSSNTAGGAGGALSWFAGLGGNLGVSDCTVEGNSDMLAAFAKLPESTNAASAFAISGSRFCLNQPANTSGPVESSGANIFSQDCNGNGVCDADEIASGAESDCNGNGIPDSCEIAGTVQAFGDNTFGQVNLPGGLGRVIQIAAGCDHGIALRIDGSLAAWGHDAFGQATVPADLGAVRAVAAGCDHNLVLLESGAVEAWGYNAFGQCIVPTLSGTVVQIAAGVNQSGVRLADGSLVLWGRNVDGECTVPPTLGAASSFAIGGAHSVGLRSDGSVLCWGLNNFGQCTVPADVGTLQAVTAGCYHTVGLRTDGTVVAWGSNIFNQAFVPPGLSGVVRIAAGPGQHTLALKSDGTVVAWGWNAFGQSSVPGSASDVVDIAAGGTHSFIRSSGAPDCDGDGVLDSCQLADGSGADCNANGVLDSCEIASGMATDCNANGELDSCEIASGSAPDCNGNLVPDGCDLASGTSTDLNGSGVPDDCEFVVGGSGFATIQSAVNAAPNGSVIQVSAGTWPPFTINGRQLIIESLDGAESTFVDGDGTARAVSLENIAPRGVVLRGFTIQNGVATTGAGVRMLNASPTIDSCIITANTATGDGGGIACVSGTPLITNCIITLNAAQRGGGAYIGGSGGLGFAQFDACTIEFNSSGAAGGGVFNESALLLTQCLVVNNTAGAPGGGLATSGASALSAIGNSFFCLNQPNNTSGGFSDLEGNSFGDDCNSNGICDLDEIAAGAEDKNANGELDSCELARGDLNLDGLINGADLSVLLNFWGAVNPPVGDLNGDGTIGGADLSMLLNNWGS